VKVVGIETLRFEGMAENQLWAEVRTEEKAAAPLCGDVRSWPELPSGTIDGRTWPLSGNLPFVPEVRTASRSGHSNRSAAMTARSFAAGSH
jgi:hypothetical protein